MRGRGGRGRGGPPRGGFGQKQIPLHAIDTFIYNPNCEAKPVVTDEEKKLIVFNRILKRCWNESEFFIDQQTTSSVSLLESYFDQFNVDFKNPNTQKVKLINALGPDYFPTDLLSLTPPRGKHRIGDSKKAFNWADLEKKEKSGGPAAAAAGTGEAVEGGESGGEEPADDNYGGEDYAKDWAGDEDRDDDFADDGGAERDE